MRNWIVLAAVGVMVALCYSRPSHAQQVAAAPAKPLKPQTCFSFDKQARTWSCVWGRDAGHGITNATSAIELDGERHTLQSAATVSVRRGERVSDDLGARSLLCAAFGFAKPAFTLTLTFEVFDEGDRLLLSGVLHNRSDKPLSLGVCDLVHVDPSTAARITLGANADAQTFLAFRASTAPDLVEVLPSGKGRHQSSIVGHLYDAQTPLALNTSFLTFDRITADHTLHYTNERGIHYRARNDFLGYKLGPGESVATEKLYIELSTDPFRTLENWADMVNRVYKPRIREDTPAGWVGWAWMDPFNDDETFEHLAMRNAAAIRRRLPGLGVDYIWLPVANLKDALPGNWLQFDDDKFPSGFENVVRKLTDDGFKPGSWLAPFWVSEAAVKADDVKDHIRRKLDGSPIMSPEWGWAYKHPKGKRPRNFSLDGTHPKTVAYLSDVVKRYRDMGLRYLMVDFLDWGRIGADEDYHNKRIIAGPEAYRRVMDTIRKAAGPTMHLQSSSGPTLLNIGCIDAARIGPDYNEGRPLVMRTPFYPATYLINNYFEVSGHCNAIRCVAANYFTHRKCFLNDSNFLTVDKPLPRNEAEVTTTLFGINGSPMMLGDDIDRIGEERLALIKKVLPRTPENAIPIDLFDSPAPDDYPKVFRLTIEKAWTRYHLVAVFNLRREPLAETVSTARLRIPDGEYRLYEFWTEQYLGRFGDKFIAHVPPTSVRLYRIEQARPHPWLLSTDMHLQQGNVELTSLEWDEATLTLRGGATRPAGESGNLFLIAPKGYALARPYGHWIAKDVAEEALIVRLPLQFAKSNVNWAVTFELWTP